MKFEIQEVTTRGDLKRFVRFPHTLYKGNPYWVPNMISSELNTLSRDKNPAFADSQARYWLALRDDKIVGRVAAILSEGHHSRWNQRYMRFGWIDFVEDLEIAGTLIKQVEDWAVENKCTAVHGPLGFSDMDQAGMLVDGFDQLSTLATIYNHPYYPVYLEKLGYVKDTDWVEYELTIPEEMPKIAKLAELVKQRYGLHMLKMKNKKDLLSYTGQIFGLINEGYQNLYGFVPISDKQVVEYTKQYFDFINPEFVPIVLDADGKMVAFGITMPSLSKAMQKAGGKLFPFGFIHLLRALKKNELADLYLVVVKPEYQGKGVNALLISELIGVFNRFGIRKAESNPELEDNLNVQSQWKHFETRQHKRRRSYIKYLEKSG